MSEKQFFIDFWGEWFEEITMKGKSEVLCAGPEDFVEMLKNFKKSFSGALCTEDEAIEYAQQKGYNARFAKMFYNHMEANGWLLKNGNKCKNWRAAMNTWILRQHNDDYKIKKSLSLSKNKRPNYD